MPAIFDARSIYRKKKGEHYCPPFSALTAGANVRALSAATTADHLDVGYRQVAVLIGMMLGFLFGAFLRIVHFLVVYRTGDAHGVANVIGQAATFALEFPGRAIVGW